MVNWLEHTYLLWLVIQSCNKNLLGCCWVEAINVSFHKVLECWRNIKYFYVFDASDLKLGLLSAIALFHSHPPYFASLCMLSNVKVLQSWKDTNVPLCFIVLAHWVKNSSYCTEPHSAASDHLPHTGLKPTGAATECAGSGLQCWVSGRWCLPELSVSILLPRIIRQLYCR